MMKKKEIKDSKGNILKVGDRVVFVMPEVMGTGEMGTITRIERDTTYNKDTGEHDLPWGDEFQYCLWVQWDCHGKEVGECLDTREGSKDWVFVERQRKLEF